MAVNPLLQTRKLSLRAVSNLPRVQLASEASWWVSARHFQEAFLLLDSGLQAVGHLPFPLGESASAQLALP